LLTSFYLETGFESGSGTGTARPLAESGRGRFRESEARIRIRVFDAGTDRRALLAERKEMAEI
jgi:hypothetical protein